MANLSVGIDFNDGKPIFDYKLCEGPGQKSYGVELAETIGLGSKQLDRLIRKRAASGELPSGDVRLS